MALLDYLFPKHCPICLRALPPGDMTIHSPCREKIRYVRGATCFKCGKPLSSETREFCRDCEKHMPPFSEGIAWGEYTSSYLRRMMSEVKYHGRCQILDYPCEDFAKTYLYRIEAWNAEALIPVPVHPSRRMSRGYNQAEEICFRLSKIWHIPVDEKYLSRTVRTAAQKELTKEERAKNLSRAFSVTGEPEKYRRVILVDDIYTTGSTVSACTEALKSAGVEEVFAAVLLIGRDV